MNVINKDPCPALHHLNDMNSLLVHEVLTYAAKKQILLDVSI